jgi:two-component system OmpR family sensor kinase
MKSFSLRTRLVLGLIGVVAIGLTVVEVTTYYSVKNFMLKRVDEQVDAARGPAATRLDIEQRFRQGVAGGSQGGPPQTQTIDPVTGAVITSPVPGDFGRGARDSRGVFVSPSGAPQNFAASISPGTYAELRTPGAAPRATSFGFDQNYPIPELPPSIQADEGRFFTVGSVASSEQFRVSASQLTDGSVLIVAVPMTEFHKTMDRLQLVGLGVSGGVLVVLAVLAFGLVRLGLKPLDEMAVTAANIAQGDMSRRVRVRNPKTEIGRLGTAMNDMMTDLEESFARRERSEEQLRRFLADASHELRTPLTSIRGYAELFGRGANARPDDLEKVMNRISQQSERMSLIVEDLLLLARLDRDRELDLAEVDLAAIAADVVEEARVRQPGRAVTINSDGPALVDGDRHRLYQVVNNLVTNALTHTPDDAEVQVRTSTTGNAAILEVTDTGPGIADEDRAHVFEPFYRASAGRGRNDGGSGLGLAIVKAIVEAHEGSVGVRNAEPHGAAFSVRLPALAHA